MLEHRERLGLSLAQLAARVGCAKSYLCALENDQRGAPSDALLVRLEQALELPSGALMDAGRWRRSLEVGGPSVRRDVEALTDTREAARRLARLLRSSEHGRSLDAAYTSGALRQLVDQIAPEEQEPQLLPIALGRNVPLINKVAAGYPTEFTDLSYP
ncbi:MAG: helix-turn-helix transcriptional regulator, partial [Planctomycetota bacterium]|nr:helix-turn-helix transcriptional regulator [Planctomycetota bacterium]